MEAIHTDKSTQHLSHSVYPVLLCKIMFIPWLSKGLATRAGQSFDSVASIIYQVGFGQRGFRARRECTPDTEGSVTYDMGLV